MKILRATTRASWLMCSTTGHGAREKTSPIRDLSCMSSMILGRKAAKVQTILRSSGGRWGKSVKSSALCAIFEFSCTPLPAYNSVWALSEEGRSCRKVVVGSSILPEWPTPLASIREYISAMSTYLTSAVVSIVVSLDFVSDDTFIFRMCLYHEGRFVRFELVRAASPVDVVENVSGDESSNDN